ncbi:hypothetical protein TSUD_49570 [Trifolium subterraneum]|uniref:Uncharacterized protein n=1 Tax=Trifolium subterraneum TaxID=3900 RepID=A0A2Z6ND36_TRISU|nr:hypothetical protein TSUD_49570 [Trifolium subterraneum]
MKMKITRNKECCRVDDGLKRVVRARRVKKVLKGSIPKEHQITLPLQLETNDHIQWLLTCAATQRWSRLTGKWFTGGSPKMWVGILATAAQQCAAVAKIPTHIPVNHLPVRCDHRCVASEVNSH